MERGPLQSPLLQPLGPPTILQVCGEGGPGAACPEHDPAAQNFGGQMGPTAALRRPQQPGPPSPGLAPVVGNGCGAPTPSLLGRRPVPPKEKEGPRPSQACGGQGGSSQLKPGWEWKEVAAPWWLQAGKACPQRSF